MKKRLRKKKYSGEFRNQGFDFSIEHDPMNEEQLQTFHQKMQKLEETYQIFSGGDDLDDIYSGFMSTISWDVDLDVQKPLFQSELEALPEVRAVKFSRNMIV